MFFGCVHANFIGNFTFVKPLKKPKFKVCRDDPYHRSMIIIAAEDVIMKLCPWPICNPLNETQYKNFNSSYTKNNGNRIFNYAFENYSEWKENGGCVIVPQCAQNNCNLFACRRHLHLNEKLQPPAVRMHHTCRFDKNEKVALLSCEQMIVQQFLKTQASNQMKNQSDEIERLIENIWNESNRSNND